MEVCTSSREQLRVNALTRIGESISLTSTVYIMHSSVMARQTFLVSDPKYQVTHHPLRAQSLRFNVCDRQPLFEIAVHTSGCRLPRLMLYFFVLHVI